MIIYEELLFDGSQAVFCKSLRGYGRSHFVFVRLPNFYFMKVQSERFMVGHGIAKHSAL